MLSVLRCCFLGASLLSLIPGVASASQGSEAEELRSRLDRIASVSDYGRIAYRAPLPESEGPPLVLFPGIYGGSSHLSWRELHTRLDKLGAAVFLLDLPGTGGSDRPERNYSPSDIENFVVNFVREVVRRPAVLVGQSTSTMFVLNAAKTLEDEVLGAVLVSPTGINVLSKPAAPSQQFLFERLTTDRDFGLRFYQDVLSDRGILNAVGNGFYDNALVTPTFLGEYALQRTNVAQRWITFSFIGGRLFRSFEVAQRGVDFPVLMLFGADDAGFGDGDGNLNGLRPDAADDFRAIRPDFQYVTLPRTGGLVWKEKPGEVSVEIQAFLRRTVIDRETTLDDDD